MLALIIEEFSTNSPNAYITKHYKLIKEYGFSSGQLDRLRKNDNISSYTLNRLCEILDCRLKDIEEYRKEK